MPDPVFSREFLDRVDVLTRAGVLDVAKCDQLLAAVKTIIELRDEILFVTPEKVVLPPDSRRPAGHNVRIFRKRATERTGENLASDIAAALEEFLVWHVFDSIFYLTADDECLKTTDREMVEFALAHAKSE